MSGTRQDVHVTGQCYCNGVGFAVCMPKGTQPIFSVYCHCDSCRRAHAAPLYHVVCVEKAMFRITRGADLLQDYTRPGSQLNRRFCRVCGSRVLNRFATWKPGGHDAVAFFPNLLDEATQHDLPEILRPESNHLGEEGVLDREVLNQLFGHS